MHTPMKFLLVLRRAASNLLCRLLEGFIQPAHRELLPHITVIKPGLRVLAAVGTGLD